MENMNFALNFGSDVINYVSSVRNPGLLLDNELAMNTQGGKCMLLSLSSPENCSTRHADDCHVVIAFVISRLDYCNSVFAGKRKSGIAPLETMANHTAPPILTQDKTQ
jgi:hypothetical protein